MRVIALRLQAAGEGELFPTSGVRVFTTQSLDKQFRATHGTKI
jgi:hypothetical protein